MDLSDHIWPGKGKKVIVALQVTGVGFETFSPVILFGQAVTLDHGAHGTIEQKDPLSQYLRD
jgi:hypothetical protein